MASIPSKSFLTLLFVSLMILPQVGGVMPRAGVKAGDWARYSVSQNMTGNKTLVKGLIAEFSPYANTSYVSLNITGVSGTNVNVIQGIHHTNGTIVSSALVVDLSSGVDPNNPPVLIMQDYPNVLNGILNGTFLGVPRIFNNLVINSGPDSNSSALRYSWDNATGILLGKLFFYSIETNATNTATFTYTLSITNTSLWHFVAPKPPVSNPPAPFDLGFAELYGSVGVLGALALGVLAYTRRRHHDTKGPTKRRG